MGMRAFGIGMDSDLEICDSLCVRCMRALEPYTKPLRGGLTLVSVHGCRETVFGLDPARVVDAGSLVTGTVRCVHFGLCAPHTAAQSGLTLRRSYMYLQGRDETAGTFHTRADKSV
jgi:hypothetical protein